MPHRTSQRSYRDLHPHLCLHLTADRTAAYLQGSLRVQKRTLKATAQRPGRPVAHSLATGRPGR
ncbi:hypothetical protein EF908_23265 [Streptomyces sp. WAC04770]|nr:hypothetical protein [Streptomyces sp. WAC04770]RST21221.1 hypothetical protein EF908_23265 [Streptomyces sp. WAC04770]